jgi:hypothetical protein
MSRARIDTVGDQITALLNGFMLTTAARELVSRFVEANQESALPLLLDVLEMEAGPSGGNAASSSAMKGE